MPTLQLEAKGIARLAVPTTGRIDYHDTVQDGLSLRVTSHGARSWSVRYYLAGRQRRATLGAYPGLSLADARERAHRTRREAQDGIDRATSNVRDGGRGLCGEVVKAAEAHVARR